MENEKIIEIRIPKTTILGSRVVEKHKNGNVVETRTGSFTYKYIASFFVVVEDDLAKEVIDLIASDCDNLPREYIIAGVWGNQAACLFGFLMYAQALKNTNIPQFSIIAVDDGDIKPEAKDKRINKLLKGQFYDDELKAAKENLLRLMYSFRLEYVDCDVRNGLPEYNHKKWFEEIDKQTILSVDKPSNPYEERKVERLLELIEFSKSIILDDYHYYYDELKKYPLKNTLELFHMTEYFVLYSIKKYNNKKWKLYTSHIKEALIAIDEENTKNFTKADIYFEKK